ncbi:hypothetical protein [Escherichia coli]|uniref:hypothetical protein n=1 Tax=Escherichia coli TaxID=562 RepID=UPI003D8188D0
MRGSDPGVKWMRVLSGRGLCYLIAFSRGSFQPRDQAQVSCIAGRFKLSHKGSPPKAKLAPKKKKKKKVMVTVWWSVASLIYYTFPNPSKITTSEKQAQQIDDIH